MKLTIALLACLHLCSGFQLRISGGHNAVLKQEEAVSTVFIMTVDVYCTGSIISKNWVLTAGHCISLTAPPKEHYIYAGIVEYYDRPWPPSAQIVRGKFMVKHPRFRLVNISVAYDDVGLIQTDKPFTFNAYVRRVPISGRSFFGHANCKVVGYGDTENGKEYRMKFMEIDKIVRSTEVPSLAINELYKNDTDNYQGTYGEGSSHLLGGDSGGPLLCGGVQFGVSFLTSETEDEEKHFTMHMATHGYVDWIKSYVKDVLVIRNSEVRTKDETSGPLQYLARQTERRGSYY